jgi:hypothetical protein
MSDGNPEQTVPAAVLSSEAAVEWHVIEPLLTRLKYDKDDVSPKHTVVFQEGGKGRKHEADFVVFSGRPHGDSTSLMVIEAKRPGKHTAKKQAESYQHAVRAPFTVIIDGSTIEVWQYQPANESELVIQPILLTDLEADFGRLSLVLAKEAATAHKQLLHQPSVGATLFNWTGYLNAELDRLDNCGVLIDRNLRISEEMAPIDSASVVTAYKGGAVITASSGMGKTSLAVTLTRKSLKEYGTDPASRMPVVVPCTEIPDDQTIGHLELSLI